MKRWLIEKLGGYADIESAYVAMDKQELTETVIEWVREQPLKEKHVWLTLAVKRLFNTIGPDDILKITESGHWLWQGKPLSEANRTLLKAEVEQYRKSFLAKVIDAELKYQANRRMFINSATELDLVAGKLLVYYTDIVHTKFKRIMGEE